MFVTAQRWTHFEPSKSKCAAPSSSSRRPLPVSCIWTCSNRSSFQSDDNDQERRIHFQQDGLPSHYPGEVRAYLNTRFPARWNGREAPMACPHRSPDLTSLDLSYWTIIIPDKIWCVLLHHNNLKVGCSKTHRVLSGIIMVQYDKSKPDLHHNS
jgi:hypothetical protein